jgi:glycosyltransferase involved in cell wall biosynthesis
MVGHDRQVLHVLGRMQPGGAEMRTLEIMQRLCPEYPADVCALSGLPGTLDFRVRELGGRVVPLALGVDFPRRFVHLLRNGGYHVVHSHVLYTSGLILALAAWAGVPVRVAHFRATHDGRPSTVRRRAQRLVLRSLIDRYATDIVGCGEGAMDAVWRTGWRGDPRCRIIYNSVDPARFDQPIARERVRAELGIPVTAPLFVHVGNAVAEKNHRRLIEIFAAIRAIAPASWLILAGTGTNSPDGVTARRSRELGVGDRVVGLGLRHDVPSLLKAADALLLPSTAEGLPGIVLEACAAGLPVLATDLPGVREVAARLRLVNYLPLSESNEQWAAVAVTLPSRAEQIKLRDTAAEAFRASVFHVDRAVEAYRALWRREAPVNAVASC